MGNDWIVGFLGMGITQLLIEKLSKSQWPALLVPLIAGAGGVACGTSCESLVTTPPQVRDACGLVIAYSVLVRN